SMSWAWADEMKGSVNTRQSIFCAPAAVVRTTTTMDAAVQSVLRMYISLNGLFALPQSVPRLDRRLSLYETDDRPRSIDILDGDLDWVAVAHSAKEKAVLDLEFLGDLRRSLNSYRVAALIDACDDAVDYLGCEFCHAGGANRLAGWPIVLDARRIVGERQRRRRHHHDTRCEGGDEQ